jgi:hypothetical protein
LLSADASQLPMTYGRIKAEKALHDNEIGGVSLGHGYSNKVGAWSISSFHAAEEVSSSSLQSWFQSDVPSCHW